MRKIKLITGPCSAESAEQLLGTVRSIASYKKDFEAAGFYLEAFRAGVWKPRTRPGTFEGIGEPALDWLTAAQAETGIPAMTEAATPQHVESALKAGVTRLWIGSRTTTNPFDVQAIADVLRGVDIQVFVKNPMNPDIDLWLGSMERISRAGVRRIGAIHRGFSFYEKSRYRNYPKWQVPIDFKSRMPEVELYCDPSHIGGKSIYLKELSQKALDLGFDGIFIESHIDPAKALSDSSQQITPQELARMLATLIIREEAADNIAANYDLEKLRAGIDILDDNILDLVVERMKIVDDISVIKRANNMTVLQPDRWEDILHKVTDGAIERGLDPDFVDELFKLVHQAAIDRQS